FLSVPSERRREDVARVVPISLKLVADRTKDVRPALGLGVWDSLRDFLLRQQRPSEENEHHEGLGASPRSTPSPPTAGTTREHWWAVRGHYLLPFLPGDRPSFDLPHPLIP